MFRLIDVNRVCDTGTVAFSDDIQLYISANLSPLQETIRASESCISDNQAWMHNNKLQLNPDNTDDFRHF